MLYTQCDKDFLLELDKEKNKTIYARITALQFNETPVETIEGRVTGGSISVDGSSALRRTCSLTLVAQNFQYNDYYWGLNTKFKLEIGLENSIAFDMPDIIWFNQGIYLITDFSTSHSVNSFSISISGKDKMCLLNGDIGGVLAAETDFGKIEEEDANGNWTMYSITIPEIIRNAVHTFAGEPYHNIIINDLDITALELLEYRYDMPMYFYREANQDYLGKYENATMDGEKECWVNRGSGFEKTTLKDLTYNDLETLTEAFSGVENPPPVRFYQDGEDYYIAKIEYGHSAGYRFTDLTYAGELIGGVGDSITDILDKIRDMLVEYEYFYNLEGQFVFQKKQSYISTPWTPIQNDINGNPAVIESYSTSPDSIYTFSGGELITSFNNSPDLGNVKNDFSIWGQRTSVSGAELPIHIRYAIDQKPISYKTIEVNDSELEAYNKAHGTQLKGQQSHKYKYTNGEYSIGIDEEDGELTTFCDWREIIYQMACDYYQYNHLDDFELKIIQANGSLYPLGKTGYENYYIDLQGFWRELFNPDLTDQINNYNEEISILEGDSKDSIGAISQRILINNGLLNDYKAWFANPWGDVNNTTAAQYFQDMESCTKQLAKDKQLLESSTERLDTIKSYKESCEYKRENYYYSAEDGDKLYWNKTVFEKPEQLNFWFDFLDSDGDISKYSVKAIGARPKSINDNSLKGIYFRKTPSVIFTTDVTDENMSEYRCIQVKDMESMFSISSQGKSVKERLDELLYQHSYCIESASIQSVPIYYLEPNTRIHIYDEKSGLNDDYILDKFNISLSHNGTMSITAYKAVNNNLN